MNFSSLIVSLVCAAALVGAPELRAQAAAKPAAPTVYKVGEGETVMTIASKLRYPAASENQMAYAIVRLNPNAFSVRTKTRLLPGAKLKIPSEATVLSYKPEVADKGVATLRKGETLYQDGLAAEKSGDVQGAVKAYIASARLGHPLADLRLGQLYDKDNSKTLPRDLQESIGHYQKAREFGIDIKGPTDRAPQISTPGVR
jgi:FimV-like protein